jgi:hypothetical protein
MFLTTLSIRSPGVLMKSIDCKLDMLEKVLFVEMKIFILLRINLFIKVKKPFFKKILYIEVLIQKDSFEVRIKKNIY